MKIGSVSQMPEALCHAAQLDTTKSTSTVMGRSTLTAPIVSYGHFHVLTRLSPSAQHSRIAHPLSSAPPRVWCLLLDDVVCALPVRYAVQYTPLFPCSGGPNLSSSFSDCELSWG